MSLWSVAGGVQCVKILRGWTWNAKGAKKWVIIGKQDEGEQQYEFGQCRVCVVGSDSKRALRVSSWSIHFRRALDPVREGGSRIRVIDTYAIPEASMVVVAEAISERIDVAKVAAGQTLARPGTGLQHIIWINSMMHETSWMEALRMHLWCLLRQSSRVKRVLSTI